MGRNEASSCLIYSFGLGKLKLNKCPMEFVPGAKKIFKMEFK
jgi:hypothetical protein